MGLYEKIHAPKTLRHLTILARSLFRFRNEPASSANVLLWCVSLHHALRLCRFVCNLGVVESSQNYMAGNDSPLLTKDLQVLFSLGSQVHGNNLLPSNFAAYSRRGRPFQLETTSSLTQIVHLYSGIRVESDPQNKVAEKRWLAYPPVDALVSRCPDRAFCRSQPTRSPLWCVPLRPWRAPRRSASRPLGRAAPQRSGTCKDYNTAVARAGETHDMVPRATSTNLRLVVFVLIRCCC